MEVLRNGSRMERTNHAFRQMSFLTRGQSSIMLSWHRLVYRCYLVALKRLLGSWLGQLRFLLWDQIFRAELLLKFGTWMASITYCAVHTTIRDASILLQLHTRVRGMDIGCGNFSALRLSLPRLTNKVFVYERKTIPIGTNIFLNSWACNMGKYIHFPTRKDSIWIPVQTRISRIIQKSSSPKDGWSTQTSPFSRSALAIACVLALCWPIGSCIWHFCECLLHLRL